MTADPNGGHKGIGADHLRFLKEAGYVAAPSHDDYVRGEGVEAEWTQYIERQDARRRAAGEPGAAEQAWKESTERYDADRRAKTLASWAPATTRTWRRGTGQI